MRGENHDGSDEAVEVGLDRIPATTHLQFLILTMLMEGERSGRDLRAALANAGVRKSGPAFYQLMGRLEDEGYIVGWYDQKVIESQGVRERRYKITEGGHAAWEDVCDFYRSHMNLYHNSAADPK